MINMINISPILSTFSPNCAENMGNVNQVALFLWWTSLRGGVPISPQMINMINMISNSPVLATFWKKLINMINISPVLATFWKTTV